MRPRFIINKGIQYDVTAVGSVFTVGDTYTAAIYNPKDTTVKILATATCYDVDGENTIYFSFTATETNYLKVGFATIEIYDSSHYRMVFRDNFATIRKNSLPISGEDDPTPLQTISLQLSSESGQSSSWLSANTDVMSNETGETQPVSIVLNTWRPVILRVSVDYAARLDQDAYTLEAEWTIQQHRALKMEGGIADAVWDKSNNGESLTTPTAIIFQIETTDTASTTTPLEIDILG